MLKSAQRARQRQLLAQLAAPRQAAEAAHLKRRVAELTQQLTLLLANRCAACRLGLIECGQGGPNSTSKSPADVESREDEAWSDDEDEFEDERDEKRNDIVTQRDQDREMQIEDSLSRLTRQAEMLAFG
jgi:hypothetical protein